MGATIKIQALGHAQQAATSSMVHHKPAARSSTSRPENCHVSAELVQTQNSRFCNTVATEPQLADSIHIGGYSRVAGMTADDSA
jgi:hypothetical protein